MKQAHCDPSLGVCSSCLRVTGINTVQSLSRVWLCNPMNRSTQASLSITNYQVLIKNIFNLLTHSWPIFLGVGFLNFFSWAWSLAIAFSAYVMSPLINSTQYHHFRHWSENASKNRLGFPGVSSSKDPACQCWRHKRHWFHPWVMKIPWRRAWQPSPIFLPGEFHGQRSLAGYSPWGHKDSDVTKVTWHAHEGAC